MEYITVVNIDTKERFVDWLDNEISSKFGTWSAFEAPSGISQSYLSRIKNGKSSDLSLQTFQQIADALRYPLEYVLQKAGWLEAPDGAEADPLLHQVLAAMGQMSLEDQRRVANYVRFELEMQREREARENKGNEAKSG